MSFDKKKLDRLIFRTVIQESCIVEKNWNVTIIFYVHITIFFEDYRSDRFERKKMFSRKCQKRRGNC